jgi:hypothetical protein
MVVSLEKYAKQRHNIKTGNKYFEVVAKVKYLGGTKKKNRSEKLKRKFTSENACSHLVPNIMSLILLSENNEN